MPYLSLCLSVPYRARNIWLSKQELRLKNARHSVIPSVIKSQQYQSTAPLLAVQAQPHSHTYISPYLIFVSARQPHLTLFLHTITTPEAHSMSMPVLPVYVCMYVCTYVWMGSYIYGCPALYMIYPGAVGTLLATGFQDALRYFYPGETEEPRLAFRVIMALECVLWGLLYVMFCVEVSDYSIHLSIRWMHLCWCVCVCVYLDVFDVCAHYVTTVVWCVSRSWGTIHILVSARCGTPCEQGPAAGLLSLHARDVYPYPTAQ